MAAEREKLSVKITILLTEEDEKNLESDIPKLRAQLEKRFGINVKVTRQDYFREMARDLHENIKQGNEVAWPPKAKLRKVSSSRSRKSK